MVTPRMRPLQIEGRTVHQVGLPYHWGYKGLVKGDVVNDLIALSEEPNVRIMETKALTVQRCAGRHAMGRTGVGFQQTCPCKRDARPETETEKRHAA